MPSREDDTIVQDRNRKKKGGRRQPATKQQTKRARARRERASMMYHETIRFAEQLGIELAPGEPVTEIIQKVFRRTHALWVHAGGEVDRLDPDAPAGSKDSLWTYRIDEYGNKLVEPSKWVQYERELRKELFEQVAMAQKLNLDEAAVRVEAAKLQVLAAALKSAVKKAGVPEEMQRKIGSALRDELAVIEGTAHESPSELQAQAA